VAPDKTHEGTITAKMPVGNLVGRVKTLVGSWDVGVKSQPVWTWPSGLRLSRFFAAVR
jgi:signal peptidase I